MRKYALFALACAACLLIFAQTKIAYRYWFDVNEAEAQTGEFAGSEMTIDIDALQLSNGLHTLHFQLVQGDSLPCSTVTKMFVKGASAAEKLRYWFDADEEAAVVQEVPTAPMDIPVGQLSEGLHALHIQLLGEYPSSACTKYFIKRSSTAPDLRYWFDVDEDNAVTLRGVTEITEIDITALSDGMHSLHVQAMGDILSSIHTKYFIKKTYEEPDLRYWFDADEANAVTLCGVSEITEIDIAALPHGVHALHAQALGSYPSSTHSRYFLKQCDLTLGESITVRTTIDGRISRLETKTIENEILALQVDVDSLPVGLHCVSIQFWSDPRSPSNTYSSYFLKVPSGKDYADAACFYTFDQGEEGYYLADIFSDGVYEINIDVSDPQLSVGEHTISCMLVLGDGTVTDMHTAEFYKSAVLENMPPYPAIEDLQMQIDANAASFSWSQPDLAGVWAELLRLGLTEEELPQIAGYHIYRNGKRANTAAIADTCYQAEIDLTEENAYYVAAAFSTGEVSEPSNRVVAPRQAKKVEISYADGMLSLSSANGAEVEIRYTLDGSEPGEEAELYAEPIAIGRNCKVRATAFREEWIASETAALDIDWLHAAKPEFVFSDDGSIYITCATAEAEIRYALGEEEPDEASALYEQPLVLTDNRPLKARAYSHDLLPSAIAVHYPEARSCAAPAIRYDGRYLEIAKGDDADVHYTLDCSDPTWDSPVYDGKVDVGGLASIKAVAMKQYVNDSETASYRTPAYFDGQTAIVGVPDSLSMAFGWTDANSIDSLGVAGSLGQADIDLLRGMEALRMLDLSQARITLLPDCAFAGSPLLWITMPAEPGPMGVRLFAGCESLAAVVWPSELPLYDSALDGIDNPNLLVYGTAGAVGSLQGCNVVADGVAESLALADGGNFFAPIEFTAAKAEYSHHYGKATPIGGSCGWETIALPFVPQAIEHESQGAIKPFAALGGNFADAKPFWLYTLEAGGWQPAEGIEANRAYLIAMPNNDEYADAYILGGTVTYSAADARVPATAAIASAMGQYSLVPTTVRVTASADVAVLDETGEYFAADERDALPFEAYLTSEDGPLRRPVRVDELGGASNGLPAAMASDNLWRVWTADGTLYISTSRAQAVTIFSLGGAAVRTEQLQPGVTAIDGLQPGLYFVKDAKVFIKP